VKVSEMDISPFLGLSTPHQGSKHFFPAKNYFSVVFQAYFYIQRTKHKNSDKMYCSIVFELKFEEEKIFP